MGSCRCCRETIRLAEATHDRLAQALAYRMLAEATRRRATQQAEAAVLEAIRIQRDVGSRPELARSYVTYAPSPGHGGGGDDEATRYLTDAVAMFRSMRMARELAHAEQLLGPRA